MNDLTLLVKYDINKDKFELSGNAKQTQYEEVIINFLRGQIGAEADDRAINKRKKKYNITISFDSNEDEYKTIDDCGNEILRNEILGRYLEKNVNKKHDQSRN